MSSLRNQRASRHAAIGALSALLIAYGTTLVADSSPALTVESVLRAIQERVYVGAMKDQIAAELIYANAPCQIGENRLIHWPHGISAFPQDGEVTSLGLKVVLEVLNDDLVRNWDFEGHPNWDPASGVWVERLLRLAPVSRFTEENWRENLKLLASNLNQKKWYGNWPTKVNRLEMHTEWLNNGEVPMPYTSATVNAWGSVNASGGSSFRDCRKVGGSGLYGQGIDFGVSSGGYTLEGVDEEENPWTITAGFLNSSAYFPAGIRSKGQMSSPPSIPNAPTLKGTIVALKRSGYTSLREGAGNLHLNKLPVDNWVKLARTALPGEEFLVGDFVIDPEADATAEYAKLKNWLALPDFSFAGAGWSSAGYENMRQRFEDMFEVPPEWPVPSPTVSDLQGYEFGFFLKLRDGEPFRMWGEYSYPEYYDFRGGGYSIAVQLLYKPDLPDLLPESTKHEAPPHPLTGVVETRASWEPVRIHLGRGKNDGYQRAWLGTRWDGFGTPSFVGSAAEFELLYETDHTEYTDEPLMAPDTPRGSFDFDESDDLTDDQKDGSGWTSRKDYLQAWHIPRLRQVLGGDVLVDIAYPSSYKKEIKFYWAQDAGAKSGKFYSPTGTPFKTVVIRNPSGPETGSGLPTIAHKLAIVENDSVFHELEAQYQYDPDPEADPRPIQVTWILKRGDSPGNAHSTRTVALPLSYQGPDFGAIHWVMTHVEDGITATVDLTCPKESTPSDTDEPVLISAVVTSGSELARTMTWKYHGNPEEEEDPAVYPGNWIPEKLTCTGPSSWTLSGAEFTFDEQGMPHSEKRLINGKEQTITHDWARSGLTRTSTWKLQGQEYRREEVTYLENLTKIETKIDGKSTFVYYHAPNSATPWQLKEIKEPNGYTRSFTSVATAADTTTESTSGWGASHQAGIKSTTVTNRLAGLVSSTTTTIEGTPLVSKTGSDRTSWGAPKVVTDSRGSTVTRDFFTDEDGGKHYGLPKFRTDVVGNTTTVNEYDWLGRPTSVEAPFGETLTPDYSDPLKDRFASSAGYNVQSTFGNFGNLLGISRTTADPAMGSNVTASLEPGNGSLSIGQRQIDLDVTAQGDVSGAKSGLGARGSHVEIGVADGMLYERRTHHTQSDGSDFQVTTYYDGRGRVKKVTYPASSSSGSLIEDTWMYNDAARSVEYIPGSGPVLKPITRTLNSDGSTLTIKEAGEDILRYRRLIEGDAVVIVTERFDDSSGSGSAWVQVSRQTSLPGAGETTFRPWDLTANDVAVSQSAAGGTSTVEISGGASHDDLVFGLNHGIPQTLGGITAGVPFSLTQINQQFGRISGGTGSVAGKSVSFGLNGDGQITSVQGPGFNKSMIYGGTPGFEVQITDSVQGTSQTFTASPAGDLTGASGSGIQPLTQSTTDSGNGVYSSTLNSNLTATTAWTGEVMAKNYADGDIIEPFVRNSDGSIAAFGAGPAHGSVEYVDNTRNISYSGGISVAEQFYRVGLRKSVSGPSDHRNFTWLRDQVQTESHAADSTWAGASISRLQDERGLWDIVTVSGPGFASRSFEFDHDTYARPERVSSGGVSAYYGYYPASGQINTCNRGLLGTSWVYDGVGRLSDANTSVSGGGAFLYQYTPDQRHRHRSRVASSGISWFNLIYDDADRLQHAELSNGTVLDYNYDGRGNRFSGGGAVTYSINSALDQVTGLDASQRGFGVVGTVAPGANVKVFHPFAPEGESVSVNSTTGAYSAFWPVAGSWGGGGVTRVEMLVRGTLTGGGNLGHDAISEKKVWVVVPATHESFDYDDAGRMTGDATWIYDWNGMNHLVGMTRKAGTSPDPTVTTEILTFSYDADGRRTGKTHTITRAGGSQQVSMSKLLWDGWLPVMEERMVNGTAQPRRWFTWGRDVSGTLDGAGGIGGLVSIQEEGGRTLLPVDDGLGNITAIVDAANGQVVARFDHGPFGEVIGEGGDVAACPFRYQSRYWDGETGLAYFGYRYYSPRLGRWLSRDPLGEAGGLNLYAYCGNDPVNRHDYLGLDPLPPPDWINEMFVFNLAKELAGEKFNPRLSADQNRNIYVRAMNRAGPAGEKFIPYANFLWEGVESDWRAAQLRPRLSGPADAGIITRQAAEALTKGGGAKNQMWEYRLAGSLLSMGTELFGFETGFSPFGRMTTRDISPGQQALACGLLLLPELRAGRSLVGAGRAKSLWRSGGSGILYPRTVGLGETTTLAQLVESGALPGIEGVTLAERTVRFGDLHALSTLGGREIEFALTREGSAFRLYSGGPETVLTPSGARVIGHTHPGGTVLPSTTDIDSINNAWLRQLSVDLYAPPAPSRVIWGVGDLDNTIFYPSIR